MTRTMKTILRHLIYSSIVYYLLAILLDILSGGAVSFFFQINLLIGSALIFSAALAVMNHPSNLQDDPGSEKDDRHLFYALTALIAILLFLALRPHDTFTAASLSVLTAGLLYSIRKHLL